MTLCLGSFIPEGFGCVFNFLLSLSLCECVSEHMYSSVGAHICAKWGSEGSFNSLCRIHCWQVCSSRMFQSSQQARTKGHHCFPIQSKSVDLPITSITGNGSDLLLLVTPQAPSLSPPRPSPPCPLLLPWLLYYWETTRGGNPLGTLDFIFSRFKNSPDYKGTTRTVCVRASLSS